MATTILHASDLLDISLRSHPQFINSPATYTPASYHHPKAGSIDIKNIGLPYMDVMDLRWNTADDINLCSSDSTDTIRINFKLDGHLHTHFSSLKHDLDMRPQTHNLIYVPEGRDVNSIPGNQSMSLLHINLDKDFFISVLGQEDTWSERIVNDLHHQRPFTAVKNPQPITTQMLHLINDIRYSKATGPMRNLLVQSRVLELVALEIDQFKTPRNVSERIPSDEVARLHQLKSCLEANFLTEHTLAQLSRYCLLNEFKVKKGFKQLFDTTVFNYLRKLRMDYAGQLLRNSALSVDEVADKLDYAHSQHFSIAFKKYTGLTPSQYQHGKQGSGCRKIRTNDRKSMHDYRSSVKRSL